MHSHVCMLQLLWLVTEPKHLCHLQHLDCLKCPCKDITQLAYFAVVQILRLVAERMQLRHPNVCTVLGASVEPVTEDPLAVRHSMMYMLPSLKFA